MKTILIVALTLTSATSVLPAQQGTAMAMVNDGITSVRTNTGAKESGEPAPPHGMVLVPGGEVVVGTELDAIDRLGDGNESKIAEVMAEVPRHVRPVEAFFIDKTEVTNLQWKVYLDATGRQPSEYVIEYGWGGPEVPAGQEHFPISNVNYSEAMQFLAWAGKRLPTEEEWTLAARGPGDTRDYPWGERWNSRNCQSAQVTPNGPIEVGTYEQGASPVGALDMCGNVWEWVDSPYSAFDGFEPYKLTKGRKSKTLGPQFNRSHRMAKGGSFTTGRNDMRIDFRLGLHPSDNDASLGFRGARSAEDGIDVLFHAYKRLLPAAIHGFEGLDLTDVVAKEITSYTHDGSIVTGHRYLAFAHPAAERGAGLAKLRKTSKDEPVTLGLLTTSQSLAEPQLPPGDYLLAYKGRGESKEYRESRRNKKSSGSKSKKNEPAPAPADGGEVTEEGGSASAPWPFVSVDSIVDDIDFPQDSEVILFYNVNNAVVGYTLLPDAQEKAKADATMVDVNKDGKVWQIQFSLDNMPRNKKMPRFTIDLMLHGEGLVD